MPSTDPRFTNAEGYIWKHMVMNDDWDNSYLLITYLNLINCNDDIFLTFPQQTLHPLVITTELIADIVIEYNNRLVPDGYKFEIDSRISGQPVYKAKKITTSAFPPNQFTYELVLS